MNTPPDGRWPPEQLRSVILEAIEKQRPFWQSPSCGALIDQLDRFIAPQIAGWVRSLLGYAIEPAEVTNSIVLKLCDPKTSATWANGFTHARDPWAYLAICARRSAADEAGHRVGELDALVHAPAGRDSAADAHLAPDHDLTPLSVVIDRTTTTILEFVDRSDSRPYKDAVRWFAENPATHQGHGLVVAKQAHEFRAMSFDADEVAALARVTWGGRPNQRVTSLFWAFLHDARFAAHASRPHRLALMDMRRRIRAGSRQSTVQRFR